MVCEYGRLRWGRLTKWAARLFDLGKVCQSAHTGVSGEQRNGGNSRIEQSLSRERKLTTGVNYLSSLVTSIDRSRINITAGTTLTNYFLAKVDDAATLSPAIAALRVLSSAPTTDDDGAREVYDT